MSRHREQNTQRVAQEWRLETTGIPVSNRELDCIQMIVTTMQVHDMGHIELTFSLEAPSQIPPELSNKMKANFHWVQISGEDVSQFKRFHQYARQCEIEIRRGIRLGDYRSLNPNIREAHKTKDRQRYEEEIKTLRNQKVMEFMEKEREDAGSEVL